MIGLIHAATCHKQWRSLTSVSSGAQYSLHLPFFLYLPITLSFPAALYPLNPARGLGISAKGYPSGSGWSPDAKQFLVHFGVKKISPLLTVALNGF